MTGAWVHTLLAAPGLSVILATSSLAFAIIKYAGAAYLIWIGIGFFITRQQHSVLPATLTSASKRWKIFQPGVLKEITGTLFIGLGIRLALSQAR